MRVPFDIGHIFALIESAVYNENEEQDPEIKYQLQTLYEEFCEWQELSDELRPGDVARVMDFQNHKIVGVNSNLIAYIAANIGFMYGMAHAENNRWKFYEGTEM